MTQSGTAFVSKAGQKRDTFNTLSRGTPCPTCPATIPVTPKAWPLEGGTVVPVLSQLQTPGQISPHLYAD